jgi:hypothetical protein
MEREIWWLRRIALVLALALPASVWIAKGTDHFWSVTSDGRLMPMPPLDVAVLSDGEIREFAARAVRETLSFGWHDFQTRLDTARSEFFTDHGFDAYYSGWAKTKMIDALKERRQLWQPSVEGPVIVARSSRGTKWWRVEVPTTVKVSSGNQFEERRIIVVLTILRVNFAEKPRGVGIESWAEKQRQ